MATHKIFAKDTLGMREQVGMNTTYSYDRNSRTLKVFWKRGEPVTLENVTEGEPIWICCDGKIPKVRRAQLPRRNADCLAWLMDFPKEARAHSREEYENLLEKQREVYSWWNYQEITAHGAGWAVTLCTRQDCGGVYHIAIYISDNAAADKDTVKYILRRWSEIRWMYYPADFVRKVLRERFGFTKADIKEVRKYIGG